MSAFRLSFSFHKSKTPTVPSKNKGTALILGLGSTEGQAGGQPVKEVKAVKDFAPLFKFCATDLQFEGKWGQTQTLLFQENLLKASAHEHLVVAGLGGTKEATPQKTLSLGAKIGSELAKHKIERADLWVDSFFHQASSVNSEDAPKDFAGRPMVSGLQHEEALLENLCLGLLLGAYKFEKYKSKPKTDKKVTELRFVCAHIDEAKAKVILNKAHVLAEAIYLARDMENTPGADMYPEMIAKEAQKAGKAAGFQVNAWNEKKLKEKGMNGILAVGQGSINPPRLIVMEYRCKNKNAPTLVLVGKGVSFDTGGVCLKPAPGMEDMKLDMCGAASVIASLFALAKLKAPVNVVGLVPSAENMNSDRAVKPGDIYKSYDGQTVEVINTDAEGRLILADALSYAKEFKPACVVDVATLTGAVLIALGDTATGLMGNDAKFIEQYKVAAERAGEKAWELPLYEEYFEDMKSKIADIKNIGSGRNAGTAKGGIFLNAFVKGAYPWLHLDIAGTGMSGKTIGAHCPADSGTGLPTRSLVEFALSL